MRTVALRRHEDVTGVSGEGIVAEGVIFSNGKLALHWFGDHQSIVIWDSVEDAMVVHGHDGKTELVETFLDAHPVKYIEGHDPNETVADHIVRTTGTALHTELDYDEVTQPLPPEKPETGGSTVTSI